jgi:hypothetical protein
MSKGNAIDRVSRPYLKDILNDPNALLAQQQAEMFDIKDGTQQLKDISPLLLKQSQLDIHDKENIWGSPKCVSKGVNLMEEFEEEKIIEPKILLMNMMQCKVRRHTGFQDIFSLIGYVAIVCGGDIDLMTQTSSLLTWLENWVLHLEMMYRYGRTHICWQDYVHEYDHHQHGLHQIFKEKLGLVISARNRWPKYALYQEDVKFRDKNGIVTSNPTVGSNQ